MKECEAPLPKFGLVCSPLVDGDDVHIQAGVSFCKLDKKTGKLLWRTLVISDGKFDSAYSSPVIATLRGKRQAVAQTRTKLAGVDLEDGTVLWSQEVPAFRGMNIYTPIVLGDRIFASTFQRGSFLYEIRESGGELSSELLWKTTTTGYMSTPVVVDGHAYVFLANRRVTCVNLKDGEKTWTSKPFGDYWSLVTNGKKILALDSKGELILLAANPKELNILDRRKISEDETWGHLAVCGGRLFVRELGAVSAYRWGEPEKK